MQEPTQEQPTNDLKLTPTSALNILINLGQVCLQSGVFSDDDCKQIYASLSVFENLVTSGENFTIKVKPDDIQL